MGLVSGSSLETATDFAQAARELVEVKGVLPTLEAIVSNAVTILDCQWAAVAAMDRLGRRPARLAATNDKHLAKTIAEISSRAGASPGITAFEEGRVVVCNDLAAETRFPAYSREMLRQTQIRSVLSTPLVIRGRTIGVLTCYADRDGAFDDRAVEHGRVLAVHATVAVEAARGEVRADNLEIALLSSRTIGAAIGILMERFKLTADQAWERLRWLSQDLNRPLADLAGELVGTGTVSGLPPDSASWRAR